MRRLTLGQLFAIAMTAVLVVITVGFGVFLRESHRSVLAESERQRAAAARRINARVAAELARADRALADLDAGIHAGAIAATSDRALEGAFFVRLIEDDHLAEITLTRAVRTGFAPSGDPVLAPDGRSQVSVHRLPDQHLETRIVTQDASGFHATTRARRDDTFEGAGLVPSGDAADPTAHPTFTSLADRASTGKSAWSDLHRSELDRALPEAEQRVVLTVQKPVLDASGAFVGVLRVGLLTRELDAIAKLPVDETDPDDPHRIALFAVTGPNREAKLVARVDPSDRVQVVGDDLRIVPSHPTPALRALLSSPLVRALDAEHPRASGSIEVGGEPWLATLQELSGAGDGTAGWFVAVLVPETHYTQKLVGYERMVFGAFAITLLLVVGIGVLTVSVIRQGLGRLFHTTTRMNDFDFSATPTHAPFRDLDEVATGLERAKTVLRTMGKYIPVDLVRRLYQTNEEPELGGELQQVSLLFTDIEGFTTLSEKLPAAVLAKRLGDYLDAMTQAITETGGIIDKFIGDAVMAMWNAPTPVPGHPKAACAAVLACKRRTAELFASPTWRGLPPLVTRYGVHQAKVMVGHFGATLRLSYTALGDGVNLAARLEPLCKQYGVTCLVSEDVVREAEDEFRFRRIDRVAVKGKTRGIEVYELLGRVGETAEQDAFAATYERAFDAYLERDFGAAEAILAGQCEVDPPSAVLAARCRELAQAPPPEGWDGVHAATSK